MAPVVYEKPQRSCVALTQIEQTLTILGPKSKRSTDFVSQRIPYRRSTARFNRFQDSLSDDILLSGYGTQEDKFLLFCPHCARCSLPFRTPACFQVGA